MASRLDFEREAKDIAASWELFDSDDDFYEYIARRADTHALRHVDFDRERFTRDCTRGVGL